MALEDCKPPYSTQFKNVIVRADDLKKLVDILELEQRRLEWLEKQVVEVRTPLRYGSRANFIAVPEEHEIGEWPSNLRSQIDKNLC